MAFSDDPEHTKSATGFDRAEEIEHVAETSDMPKGYFRSPLFLGSYTAAGLGLLAAIAGFSFIAPVLSIINEDVGPSTNISWIAILYTLAIAVGLTVAGRLGDLFGRRYVFITGAVLGVIGSIVSALANSVTVLIVGMLFIGLAASTQVSYFYVIAELTPNKYRFIGNAVGYIFAIPGGAFAPALAHSAILHTSAGWRTLYWILLGLNVAALVCWVVFYRPPTFAMKHMHARRRDYVRHFDYVGCVLFVGGLVLFLLGLQWGGSAYPWNSAHVIATLTVGLVSLLAFVLWECFANLAEPLVPMQLLRAPGFLAAVVVSGLGASLYYALGVVWPSMVTNVYASGDFMTDGWVASITGVGWVFGEILSGFLAKPLGRIKEQCIVTLLIAGVFLGSMHLSKPHELELRLMTSRYGDLSTEHQDDGMCVAFVCSVLRRIRRGSSPYHHHARCPKSGRDRSWLRVRRLDSLHDNKHSDHHILGGVVRQKLSPGSSRGLCCHIASRSAGNQR